MTPPLKLVQFDPVTSPAAPRRRWFQVSLREIALLVALLSICAAWVADHVRQNNLMQTKVDQLTAEKSDLASRLRFLEAYDKQPQRAMPRR